jgi:hypothetical protein
MSFWNTSEGENLTQDTSGEYDAGGGMDPIPNNTDVLAAIDEIKIDEKDGAKYVSARWSVMKPEAFINRKVFQKIWCMDHDPNAKDHDKAVKKTDKAKRMLVAIDHNAGGKLVASGKMPTDDLLQMHLMNTPMVIKVMTWEMKGDDGSMNSGNWVAAVADKSKPVSEVTASPKPSTPSAGGGSQEMDDEIPF